MVVQSLFADTKIGCMYGDFRISLGSNGPISDIDIIKVLQMLENSSSTVIAIKNEGEYSDVKSMQKAFKRIIEKLHLGYETSTNRAILLIRKPYSLI